MKIGQTIICKHRGQVVECKVIEMFENDLLLDYQGERVTKKYWEVRKWEPKNETD